LKTAFLIFSVLCLAGTFASLVRGRLHANNPGNAPE
jgi:hypothetical protein